MSEATHEPAPLHIFGPVSVAPVQVAAPHEVFAAKSLHAPLPSQPPTRPQVVAAWAGHSFFGSLPSPTIVQVPTEPGRLQEEQVPAHAVLQQTPSAQAPVAH